VPVTSEPSPAHRDLAASAWRTGVVWGPGVLLIALTGPIGGWPRTLGWTAGLLWLAAFCLWNYARCRRVHCLFTGPFFLAMAVATLLVGFGIFSLGRDTWSILGDVTVAGALVLYCVPEWLWGRYRHDP
jgi:hypothetical protein